jgi:polysaccharide export outer membrane protein
MNRNMIVRAMSVLLILGVLSGCHVDSFFDPSKTGYFEPQPTVVPILERIDAIEASEDEWGQTTSVTPEDLIPSDLSYRMVPGDFVTVRIFELYAPNQWSQVTRRIDAGGFLRLPEIGDVQAAGLGPQEFEDVLVQILAKVFLAGPQVEVAVEEGSGFFYTMYGALPAPGLYTLRNPDLRLMDALAIAGGVPVITDRIFIIRQVALTEDVKPSFQREDAASPVDAPAPQDPPEDIESLIDDLRDDDPVDNISPGVLRQDGEPIIDIDDLEPVRVSDQPVVDIDEVQPGRPGRVRAGGVWVYVEERGEWVRVAADDEMAAQPAGPSEPPLYIERIIEIPYKALSRGESRYNIVIRPRDRIFIEPPSTGVVYIDGEIARPGVYGLPADGALTLSRLVAAAGGPGPLAIPERVDLTRIVGEDREATIRLNLAAIRQRTEPDLYLKGDDHIIIGTNWVAAPLAVIRNGFRATYGFGFLLDRNFGNDVFGAPPSNVGN